MRLQTVVGTQRGLDELVIADGVARPIVDSECKGTERAEWSQDGLRVFRTTDVTCNKETARTIKSVAFLAPGPTWINVQHVSGESATTGVRVQRYRRAINQNLADGSKAPQPSGAASASPARRHDVEHRRRDRGQRQVAGRGAARPRSPTCVMAST